MVDRGEVIERLTVVEVKADARNWSFGASGRRGEGSFPPWRLTHRSQHCCFRFPSFANMAIRTPTLSFRQNLMSPAMHEFVTHRHIPACLAHSLCGEDPWALPAKDEHSLMQMKLQQSPWLGFCQEMESDFRLACVPSSMTHLYSSALSGAPGT